MCQTRYEPTARGEYCCARFPEADAARAEELNAKANNGALTDDERSEREAYANISDLLAYWQSKARQVLQQA